MNRQLKFRIVSDVNYDFDVLKEASLSGNTFADIQKLNGLWHVNIGPIKDGVCDLSWDEFERIYQEFKQFKIEEDLKGKEDIG